ncbi:hypothetical protein NE612_01220 [Oscillibacter valericigenes]|nr:hypothetical protein [Oscillibacter valericigenes]
MGLTYEQALDIPFGELLDYVAIEQIKHEGAWEKSGSTSEDDEFFELLSRR